MAILRALFGAFCQPDGPRDNAVVIHEVARNTTVRLVKTKGRLSSGISLYAIGALDDSATMTLKNSRQLEKLYWQTWLLPRGKPDSLKQRFDYYDHDVDMIYSHRNVSRGKLQITITY